MPDVPVQGSAAVAHVAAQQQPTLCERIVAELWAMDSTDRWRMDDVRAVLDAIANLGLCVTSDADDGCIGDHD